MTVLAAWLFAAGIGDLIRDLSGGAGEGIRARLASPVAALAGAAMLAAAGHGFMVVIGFFIGTTGALFIWGGLRGWDEGNQERRSLGAFFFFLGISGFLLLIMPWLAEPAASNMMQRWLGEVPAGILKAKTPQQLAMLLGISSYLLATGNALVRVILTATGIRIPVIPEQGQDTQLRGGRVIGPMERLLILGFFLVGEPTGAALIVAAKSLLRFPEVSRADRESPGDGTEASGLSVAVLSEYFLVGSLASWLIALIPAFLLT